MECSLKECVCKNEKGVAWCSEKYKEQTNYKALTGEELEIVESILSKEFGIDE